MRERLAVGEADALDLDDALAPLDPECRRDRRRGRPPPGVEHARAGVDALAAQLLGETRERAEVALELRARDERAAAAPLRAHEQSLALEGAERLTHRHPADAELRGELALGRQPVARRELPVRDRLAELVADLQVGGPVPLRLRESWSFGLIPRSSGRRAPRRRRG